MLNLRKLFIPKENAQVIRELQSWTVHWWVKTGWSDNSKHAAKVFVSEAEADEFAKQITESAKFIGAWVKVSVKEN